MSEEEQKTESTPAENSYLVPGAIIIAGLLIAGAVLVSQNGLSFGGASGGNALGRSVMPIEKSDHKLGAKKPDVYLIEYSDFQCPYCTRFHATVKQVLEEYGDRVAWVYRHFPLDAIHPEARPAAVAAECAGEVGGEDAFWSFTDRLFESESGLSSQLYTSVAAELGLDEQKFADCIVSGRYDDLIEQHSQNAQLVGGNGTPHTVLLTKKGNATFFKGALPVEQVRSLVESALKSLE